MDLDSKPQETQEAFEEIDTTGTKLEIKENVSLLDRGKGTKKRSRTNSPTPSLNTNMTRDQIKFCGAIMRNLKKHRDAAPFLHPVDYLKLNVPEYPKVIKHPMDLTSVDRKLNGGQYDKVEDFVAEIRLVFNNCFKFNGPEAMISMLCQNVESAFEKSLRQMPPSKDSAAPSRVISPVHDQDERGRTGGVLGDDEGDDMSTNKKKKLTNTSTHKALTPPLRGMGDEGRPKREIHPPPSKDYPETMTKRRANNPRKNDVQMKFCMQALKEMKKTKYRDLSYPFLAPVDVVALNIPDYVNIVKHPMDMSTIERKLNEGEYDSPDEFEDDVRLMFNNCYLYNPPTLPVHRMARDLEKVFDEKWAQLPPVPEPVKEKSSYDEPVEEEEEESDNDDRDHKIAELERHIATISQQIASIKSSKKKKTVEKPVRRRTTKEKKPVRDKKKRTNNNHTKKTNHTAKRKPVETELMEFTFDQKKDLSEQINNLTGDRLNTVVNIIQNSMPNLDGQGQEEIVLDIDSLDRGTLHALHEFVTGEKLVASNKASPLKRQRTQYNQVDSHHSSSGSESDSDSGSGSDDSGSSSDEM